MFLIYNSSKELKAEKVVKELAIKEIIQQRARQKAQEYREKFINLWN